MIIKNILLCKVLALLMFFGCTQLKTFNNITESASYKIKRISEPMIINAAWEKPQWQSVNSLKVTHILGDTAKFIPKVEAKLLYDSENIYVIFRVKDKYVRVVTSKINGPVWEDSAVEFFFVPNINLSDQYFNVEINAGGTPLIGFKKSNDSELIFLDSTIVKEIEIAHSLPKIINPEIDETVTWTLEYRLPLNILNEYCNIAKPEQNIIWKANFFKIAENNSNPHYITWSEIKNKEINFHQPKYFGVLKFH